MVEIEGIPRFSFAEVLHIYSWSGRTSKLFLLLWARSNDREELRVFLI